MPAPPSSSPSCRTCTRRSPASAAAWRSSSCTGVQANAYLTPPGAQGFRVHYDTHDVLVLQVEGEKAWRVWPGQPLPHPTRRTPWQREMTPEGEPAGLTLRPGEVLYLPRGTLHDARGQAGAASLHLTIGLLEPSWADAMRLLLDRLEATRPELREPFPSWRLAEPAAAPALLAALTGRLTTLGSPAAAGTALAWPAGRAGGTAHAPPRPRPADPAARARRPAAPGRWHAAPRRRAAGRPGRAALGRRPPRPRPARARLAGGADGRQHARVPRRGRPRLLPEPRRRGTAGSGL